MKLISNWKFSFYLRKYVLKELDAIDDAYYILKRKGNHRFDPATLQVHRQNLYNWSYWDQLVNGYSDSIFQKAQQKHECGSLITNHYRKEEIVLKDRQKVLVEKVQGKILDVGCFDGKLVCYLNAQAHDCYGMDFNNYYLSVAGEKLSQLGCSQQKLKKGLFQDIPFADDSFDTVISQETLEHFFFPDIMLAEIKRVLKPGGRFIGSVPLENRIDSPSHVVYYTLPGIKNLLSQFFYIQELKTMKSKPTNKSDKLIVWTART